VLAQSGRKRKTRDRQTETENENTDVLSGRRREKMMERRQETELDRLRERGRAENERYVHCKDKQTQGGGNE